MKRADYADQHIQRLEVLQKSGLYEVGALQAISRKLSSYELKLQRKHGGLEVILTYAAYAQTLELLHDRKVGHSTLHTITLSLFLLGEVWLRRIKVQSFHRLSS